MRSVGQDEERKGERGRYGEEGGIGKKEGEKEKGNEKGKLATDELFFNHDISVEQTQH